MTTGLAAVRSGLFETHARSISDTWLHHPVGARYEYSNLGVDPAGHVAARRA